MSRVRTAMDQYGEEYENDRKAAADLRAGVASLEALEGETVRENGAGVEVWRLTLELVKQLNEVLLQTLPSFWKVAKGYMEGKYQKVSSLPTVPAAVLRSLTGLDPTEERQRHRQRPTKPDTVQSDDSGYPDPLRHPPLPVLHPFLDPG